MSSNPECRIIRCLIIRIPLYLIAIHCAIFMQLHFDACISYKCFFSENIVCVAISQVRQEMHLENLAQQYLAYLIKKMCWDDMETKGNIHICV